MIKVVKYEAEGWICDCGKEWPEDIDNCLCGKSVPEYIKGVNEERFPYIEFSWEFPAKYEVCGCCEGRGVTTFGYSSSNQIAFTESEWAEEDPEFREDYMAGRYDKSCPECNGERVVLEIDERKFNSIQTKLHKVWCEHLESEYRYNEMCAAERRMGC